MFLILKSYWAMLVPLLCAVAGRYLSIKAPISGSVHFCLCQRGIPWQVPGWWFDGCERGGADWGWCAICRVLATRKPADSSLCRASLLL